MCELTFCSLKSRKENIFLGMILTRIGSVKHDDGTGLLLKDGMWKTEIPAHNIINYGRLLSSYIVETNGYEPVAFHVRSATRGISVTEDNAHPFVGKHFTLMHNGTLEFKDDDSSSSENEDFWGRAVAGATDKGDSDSLKFLSLMDKIKEENEGFGIVDVVNKAMEQCTGKFAFIILEHVSKDFYIIRGDTADLWISEYYVLTKEENKKYKKDKVLPKRSKDGYVINTNRETLSKGLLEFVNIYQLMEGDGYNVAFSAPYLLERETAFLATETGIENVGKVKEKRISYATNTKSSIVHVSNSGSSSASDKARIDGVLRNALSGAKRISEFLEDVSISPQDLQLMFGIIYGTSLLEVEEGDVESFFNDIVPAILSKSSKKFRKHVRKSLNNRPFPRYAYKKFGLLYPWFLNDKDVINKVLPEIVRK